MAAGQTVFADDDLSHALWMRDVDIDFAILPKPMWDEAQGTYITPVDGGGTSSGVMLTATDLELIGVMMEAINAESWRSVTPAIVDTALKFKGARDADSMEMIDIILNSISFDFGINAWQNEVGVPIVQRIYVKNDPNVASTLAKMQKSVDAQIKKLVEKLGK